MKRKGWLVSSLILGMGVVIGKEVQKQKNRQKRFKSLRKNHEVKQVIPTVLIHGTNGTRRSLGGMIERFEKRKIAYKALDIEISKEGKLTLTGNWHELELHQSPLIQVLFKEGNPPEWQQSEWVKGVLELLKKELSITEVNLLGHSMGGVASVRYLAEHGQNPHLPKVKKLVVIGAPFNGEEVSSSGQTVYDLGKTGPLKEYPTYRYLKSYYQNIPSNLELLNIYGDLKNGSRSDGFVSVDSARAIYCLIKTWLPNYRERRIFGVKAQHSLLHENKHVDRLTAAFLWGHHLNLRKGVF